MYDVVWGRGGQRLAVLGPRTRALAFFDSLLRCGVATLFVLDSYRRASYLLDDRYIFLKHYVEIWQSRLGAGEWHGFLVAWSVTALGGLGAIALMFPRRAPYAALALALAMGLELATIWGEYWVPGRRLPFILGIALVLVSQSILRARIRAEIKQAASRAAGREWKAPPAAR